MWVISDLDSTNGTTVDGEPVKGEFPLSPGATIRFGEVAVLFEPMDASVDAHASGTRVMQRIDVPAPPPPVRAGGRRRHRGAPAPSRNAAAHGRQLSTKKVIGLDMGARAVRDSRRGGRRAGLPEVASVRFTCAARTDVGIVRSGNEDNYLMLSDRGLFIVADGMGGHAAGEVASEMAVRLIAREVGSLKGLDNSGASSRLAQAIRTANDAIFSRTLAEHDKRGMGTTATVMVLLPGRYLIGQVGDSRAYLLRNGALHQLTKDHSYVQEQVDAGLLTPEQARVHPYANVITRCVGASVDVVPDIYFGHLQPGDVVLLASDGLTGMLEDEQLERILRVDGGPERWVDRMITEANRRGGLDNITAIAVKIETIEGPTGEYQVSSSSGDGMARQS